ncbi:methyl-accepting chemotaxis protein [Vibrio vulnificus]|uniref:methyl-accepting chemotaxis protein n=1 Tax=Vibrio vulnificus TaxID=672 RepID=UPI002934198F|nr:methyl-accepting chemotaxis protein [Vibrio vulnificus]
MKMFNLGLKKALLLSVSGLVAVSVSLANLASYHEHKSTLTENILSQNQSYVEGEAKKISNYMQEKVNGVRKVANQHKNHAFNGTPEQIIEQTKFLANAMNVESAVIAFDTGDAYWNMSSDSWPNHKLNGNVVERPWYQAAQRASDVSVTDPYLGTDGVYWVTIIDKVKGGTVSADMTLSFLNEMVKTIEPGTVAVIMNSDTTLLASSSTAIKAGEKASSYGWFKEAAQNAVNDDSALFEYNLNGQDKLLFSKSIQVGDKKWVYAVGLDKSVAFAALSSAKTKAIMVAIIATVISVTLAFILINLLYRPIVSLRNMITSLSSGSGDLTQRLAITSDDDIGRISQGVNQFIEQLQRMMLEVQSVSEVLKGNVDKLKEQSKHNAQILQSHVTETEQIVTAVEEMDATANSMATDAANTANLTQQANRTSDESKRIVDKSKLAITALIDDVENASSDVQKMNSQTQSISKVLTVIGDIAEQTNLLALNAAIEAARAGDQGRGFAVVADEVRKLASRTKDSTGEIENALKDLLNGCQKVVESMQYTKERCLETAAGSSDVETSLESLTQYVNEINDLSSQIATAAEEQSSVTQEVSRNMSAISEIVSNLDRNGQDASRNAQDIASVNDQLITIVNRFKL